MELQEESFESFESLHAFSFDQKLDKLQGVSASVSRTLQHDLGVQRQSMMRKWGRGDSAVGSGYGRISVLIPLHPRRLSRSNLGEACSSS